jgi:hypothetical protein
VSRLITTELHEGPPYGRCGNGGFFGPDSPNIWARRIHEDAPSEIDTEQDRGVMRGAAGTGASSMGYRDKLINKIMDHLERGEHDEAIAAHQKLRAHDAGGQTLDDERDDEDQGEVSEAREWAESLKAGCSILESREQRQQEREKKRFLKRWSQGLKNLRG